MCTMIIGRLAMRRLTKMRRLTGIVRQRCWRIRGSTCCRPAACPANCDDELPLASPPCARVPQRKLRCPGDSRHSGHIRQPSTTNTPSNGKYQRTTDRTLWACMFFVFGITMLSVQYCCKFVGGHLRAHHILRMGLHNCSRTRVILMYCTVLVLEIG